MSKKPMISLSGLVNPDQVTAPIPGNEQRGEAVVLAEPKKRGRPAKAVRAGEARPSFGLDAETHAKFKIWLLKNGVSMQDYLEAHVKDLVKDISL